MPVPQVGGVDKTMKVRRYYSYVPLLRDKQPGPLALICQEVKYPDSMYLSEARGP